MICGTLSTFILVAHILGEPTLSLKNEVISRTQYCDKSNNNNINTNTTVEFKDEKGKSLYSKNIYIPVIEHYDSLKIHGGVPSKNVVISVQIAHSKKILKAKFIQIRIPSHNFDEIVTLDNQNNSRRLM